MSQTHHLHFQTICQVCSDGLGHHWVGLRSPSLPKNRNAAKATIQFYRLQCSYDIFLSFCVGAVVHLRPLCRPIHIYVLVGAVVHLRPLCRPTHIFSCGCRCASEAAAPPYFYLNAFYQRPVIQFVFDSCRVHPLAPTPTYLPAGATNRILFFLVFCFVLPLSLLHLISFCLAVFSS